MDEGYTGEIKLFANRQIPYGWLPCDGSIYQIQQHPQLFSVIGVTYGQGQAGTFKVPDLRGLFPTQCCNIYRPSPEINYPLGHMGGGNQSFVLDKDTLPAHTHALTDSGNSITGQIGQAIVLFRFAPGIGNSTTPVAGANALASLISNEDGAGEIPYFNSITPNLNIGGVSAAYDVGTLAFNTQNLTVSNAYEGGINGTTYSVVPPFLTMTFFINYSGTLPIPAQ